MDLGMIGLGRMGANMVRRLLESGQRCVVYDLSSDAVARVAAQGASPAAGLEQLCAELPRPRSIWVMVPAAVVGVTLDALAPHLDPGDVVVDGGNSWYRDGVDRADQLLRDHGVHLLDVGTSGGVHGLERGYCLMVGGDAGAVTQLTPVFECLAPGFGAAPGRTPGRIGEYTPEERGWLHCGPSGAGHFVKMVHNGIEYGLMAAYAEGLNVLARAGVGRADRPADAETAPLTHPQYYGYDFDLAAVTELWRRGSVVTSWLLDLTATALVADPHLAGYTGHVSDSGEGRWTLHAAVDEGVPVPVLSAAVYQRFSSRGRSDLADKVLSAMRQQFGGHVERPAEPGSAS